MRAQTKEETKSSRKAGKPKGSRNKKTLELFALLDKGYEPEHAFKLVYGKLPAYRTQKHHLQEYRKHVADRPEIVEAAHQALEDALKMKPIKRKGEVIMPNYNTRMQAIKMVLDRVDPVVNINHNLNVTKHLAPVDLEKYKTVDAEVVE